MNIAVVGTGYVGLVTGACFADMGLNVVCVDINEKIIDSLKRGIMPIYEPGIKDFVDKNYSEGRLDFSTSLKANLDNVTLVFCAVGTPQGDDGSADLSQVLGVAAEVGYNMNRYVLFVTKSTVPVGTACKVREIIAEEQKKRGVDIPFDVASNPEFLKEGSAIKDFINPDRVIVGVDNERARAIMERIYQPFILNGFPVLYMDIASAEMTKYAANAMLATRISFMNEIAALCEKTGANVDSVRMGVGSDKRIGPGSLYAGAGYGGSCFPKDVRAFIRTGEENDVSMSIVKMVEEVNDRQKEVVFNKLYAAFKGDLKGRTIAVWGLSFKPDTDDMREAPSLVVIEKLLSAGVTVKAFDPVAMDEAKRRLGDKIGYCNNIYDAATGADAIAVMTEWKQFRLLQWREVRSVMTGNIVVDGRNIYDAAELASEGLCYIAIGK